MRSAWGGQSCLTSPARWSWSWIHDNDAELGIVVIRDSSCTMVSSDLILATELQWSLACQIQDIQRTGAIRHSGRACTSGLKREFQSGQIADFTASTRSRSIGKFKRCVPEQIALRRGRNPCVLPRPSGRRQREILSRGHRRRGTRNPACGRQPAFRPSGQFAAPRHL